MRRSELGKTVAMTLLALVVMGIILFPVYYIFTISLKPSGALATTQLELIPRNITLENYREIFFGHEEGVLKTRGFTLKTEDAVITDPLNRFRMEVKNGKIEGKRSSARLSLSNIKTKKIEGGTKRMKEDGSTVIVGGKYLLVKAGRISAVLGVRNINVSGEEIILTVSDTKNLPVDLSKFEKTGNNTYVARSATIYLPQGGMIDARNDILESKNFEYIVLSKVGGNVWGYMKRSLIIASLTVLLTLLLVIPSAYSFSRLKFFGREHTLYFYLMFTQVSGGLGIAGLVALYGMLVKLHLTNNIYVLPVIYSAGSVPFNTWLLKGYLDSISTDFDEAALVDGASYLQIIRHVLIPMALPGIATVAVFAFIGGWTELILANLLLSENNYPLTVWLYTMLSNLRSISWNQFAAAALIFALPVFIMFLLSQNYIRSGLTLGGLKE
ncbi:ABC transporter permease subunit [Thermococcus atlanticus]